MDYEIFAHHHESLFTTTPDNTTPCLLRLSRRGRLSSKSACLSFFSTYEYSTVRVGTYCSTDCMYVLYLTHFARSDLLTGARATRDIRIFKMEHVRKTSKMANGSHSETIPCSPLQKRLTPPPPL